ncbi:MAG: phosphatidylserine/phosphatidylglycerophosphate/cardiolipin synthase family protein [Pelovirga sp.]
MKLKIGKIILVVTVVLIALWLLGRAVLTVQLPDRVGLDLFTADRSFTLREAFDELSEGAGQKEDALLLEDNGMAWLERWRLLQDANDRLDISYFILKQDVFGISFLGHLVKKAQDGVRIRLLLDAMGVKMSRSFKGNDYLNALIGAGEVDIRMYRPLKYRFSDAFLTLNPAAIFISEHDKILLADDMTALIGGRNISADYFTPPEDNRKAFGDTDILLLGREVGRALEKAFSAEYDSDEAKAVEGEALELMDSEEDLLLAYRAMDAWLHGRPIPEEVAESIVDKKLPWLDELSRVPHLRGALQEKRPTSVSADIRIVNSRSRLLKSDDPITSSLIQFVRSAQEEIFIQNPYLVLPAEAVDILAEASARGVRITVITNSPVSSDNPMSQGVFLEQWPELLAQVPTLKLYVASNQHNLHGKVAVIDRQLALVGTYNLDPLSIALNSLLPATGGLLLPHGGGLHPQAVPGACQAGDAGRLVLPADREADESGIGVRRPGRRTASPPIPRPRSADLPSGCL